jgi:hypothetical protein
VPRPKRGRYGAPAFFDSVVARRPLCTCLQCQRETIISVYHWPGDLAVASVGLKMMCTKCGTIGADARPNWPAFILALCYFCHACSWYFLSDSGDLCASSWDLSLPPKVAGSLALRPTYSESAGWSWADTAPLNTEVILAVADGRRDPTVLPQPCRLTVTGWLSSMGKPLLGIPFKWKHTTHV